MLSKVQVHRWTLDTISVSGKFSIIHSQIVRFTLRMSNKNMELMVIGLSHQLKTIKLHKFRGAATMFSYSLGTQAQRPSSFEAQCFWHVYVVDIISFVLTLELRRFESFEITSFKNISASLAELYVVSKSNALSNYKVTFTRPSHFFFRFLNN